MKKGFTLIELLMVIAIIGILSAIIITTIHEIQEKGYESRMEANFSSLRAQAERYYSKYNSFSFDKFSNLCTSQRQYGFGGKDGPGIFKDLAKEASVPAVGTLVENETIGEWDHATCHATSDAWVVEVPLPDSKESSPLMYCEDSTGVFKEMNTNIVGYDYSCY